MKPDVVGEILNPLINLPTEFPLRGDCVMCGFPFSKEVREKAVTETRQQLWKAVERVVPEEKEEVMPKYKWGVRAFDKKVGHNSCRKETLKRLKQLILGEEV